MPMTVASGAAALDRTRRLSRFADRVLQVRPELAAALDAGPVTREAIREALKGDPGALPGRLRRVRERTFLTLAHRDLNGIAPLDEVFATMTALAEESIAAAVASTGVELTVAALGKLGGEELNVSSDVDLVFLHDDDPANAERYAAAGRKVIALLSELTADGAGFRVDMRLRPFGDSGPIVTSLAALEEYFTTHARPWERYAWLKARVVAGPAPGVAALVLPFVYRRYLDYGMLDAMRELHARIFEAATRRGKADDIKVGAGGIREIEFVVQLHQMVRGGRDEGLRTTSTRAGLRAATERGLVDAERAATLSAAYAFLRKLEHRLQYYDDQQTQALPRESGHQALIAESMGHSDWVSLERELNAHRARVQEAFNALFEAATHEPAARLAAWLTDPQAAPDAEGLADDLREAGVTEAPAVARRLIEFTRSRRYRSLSPNVRGRMEKLFPAVVDAVAAEGGREDTAARLLALFEAIDRREAYFALLFENPLVLKRAAHLVARSAWAARLLARHPILLDELTHPTQSFAATDWKAEHALLAKETAALANDVERLLDNLRHFKQRHMLRLTIADIEGELPVMLLSDELSALADTILDVMLEAVAGERLAFAIVAYGKLGGKELGYGSDLDIIFVHDENAGLAVDRLSRTAQRLNTWLTSITSAGVLYETDLRLRPDGASGLLVSSLGAFREYQLTRAWMWEHQALTRARFAAGDATLGARFEDVRDEILARPRDVEKVFGEIDTMRRKMRAEHKSKSLDLKHADGGLIDLEFSVQALVLAHGPRHAALRENKGNHTLLKRAAELGLVERDLAVDAANAYIAMRARTHEAALNDEEGVKLKPGELEAEREAVRRLRRRLFAREAP
ncbi:MAG TPA: bifunctional [glutamate--ammonia ligase]-adenylyl-L-tyrosine phosphorylase/[glutamate--ammonia-ligase] adenylyltransferase [Usitatibacter sp.]|nr:bifunctional [glutamate--ammonia ligase]-adenylyl-L-tyrosine phosphorylase/[glutamate--ammonia-ligase] adenylyltransferase [Usitatibacter sp.]